VLRKADSGELPDEVRLTRLIARRHVFGKTLDAVRACALGSDQANAELVATSPVTRRRAGCYGLTWTTSAMSPGRSSLANRAG
jgi:hypothetical protein